MLQDYFGWKLYPTICATQTSGKTIRLAKITRRGLCKFSCCRCYILHLDTSRILLLDEHCSLPLGSETFGFDIYTAMFLVADTTPPKITLYVLDGVHKPLLVPTEWLETFNLAHARRLIGGVAKIHDLF